MSNKQLAYSFAQSLTEHNLGLYASLLHENYINHNAFAAPGKTGSVGIFTGFLTAFPDFRVTLENVIEESDFLVGRFKYHGTFTEPFMGYKPTGNVVEMRSIDIWQVKDGLLFEHWDELNTLDFFMQLGAAMMSPPNVQAEEVQ